MKTILVSFVVSAVTTFLITTKVKMDILRYVNEMCEINIEQVEKVKTLALSTIKNLADVIRRNNAKNQEGDEHHV